MKSFIVLSQYLFLGFSLIAALKVAKDGNIEISFVFVLLSLNFGLNLINQKQLIIKMAKTTKQQIYFDELNNKIASVIDKNSNLSVKFEFFKREFFILKEDLVQLGSFNNMG